MARKPKRSHRAYKEWAPSVVIITHGKIDGRATVNLKINILDSRTDHSSRLKKAKWEKEKMYVSIMSKTKVIHSQRQPRNLKRMLTNSYFSRLKDTDPEVKICGTKRCGTCPYLKQGKEFTFSTTNETFWIKHLMNCTSMNLIT